jgi:hypothetical protein
MEQRGPKPAIQKALTTRRRRPPVRKRKTRCAKVYNEQGQRVTICDYEWNKTKLPVSEEETLLLNCLIDVSEIYIGSYISKDRLRKDWDVIRTTKIPLLLLAAQGDARKFVTEIHAWIRVYLEVPHQNKSWNAVLLFDSQVTNPTCNCICSTMFILLACAAAGFFPGQIAAATVPRHIFLSYLPTKETFETTRKCETQWHAASYKYPRHGFRKGIDRPIYDLTAQAACAHYLANALNSGTKTVSSTRKRIGKYSPQTVLEMYSTTYGDFTQPTFVLRYISVMGTSLPPEFTNQQMEALKQSMDEHQTQLTLSLLLKHLFNRWYKYWVHPPPRHPPLIQYRTVHLPWSRSIIKTLTFVKGVHPDIKLPWRIRSLEGKYDRMEAAMAEILYALPLEEQEKYA